MHSTPQMLFPAASHRRIPPFRLEWVYRMQDQQQEEAQIPKTKKRQKQEGDVRAYKEIQMPIARKKNKRQNLSQEARIRSREEK